MTEQDMVWYVLFPNHNEGITLDKLLKKAGISATIVPTPRRLSACCGISLMVQGEDVEIIRQIVADNGVAVLDIAELESDINPNRDRYC